MLRSEGHADCYDWPLYRIWEEVRFAQERINGLAATSAVLIQLAVASQLDKKAGKEFTRTIKRLTDG